MNKDNFIVSLEYREFSEEAKESKTEVLWTDKITLKFIRSLFRIVGSEMSKFGQMARSEAKFDSDKYFEVITSNFGANINNYKEKILKKIKNLKKFYFRSRGLTIHLDEIIEDLKALRYNRIKFWEDLLRNFTENEDFYLSKIERQREKTLL